MKVRIYKSGGGVGKFISKLDKFLPTAAEGAQVDQMKQLKDAIKYQLDDKNQSESSVVLQLIRAGYDYAYAKNIVDTVSDEIEEDYYSKKNKKRGKESMMDSDIIPNEEDLAEEEDRKKRKLSYQNMSDDIAQTAEDVEYEDIDDDNEFNEILEAGSPYDEETPTAAYGMEVNDPKIQWPGMFNDMASLKKGGVPNKNKFIKSTVKKLKKASAGMQKDPSMNDMPSPYGTLENPLGINVTPNKNVISAIKDTAQNFVNEEAFKKQAEQMYNQQFMQPMAEKGMEMNMEKMWCPDGKYYSSITGKCESLESLKQLYHDAAYTARNTKNKPVELQHTATQGYKDYVRALESEGSYLDAFGQAAYHVGSQSVGVLKELFGFKDGGIPMAENGGADDWATNLHNYGEALSHQMPNMNMNAMNTQYNQQEMAFGGTSRRVRRANKAFFGLPIVPPGAKTDYQFGPLGGLKRGQVEYDLGQIGELLKTNPKLASMFMPKIGMGMPSGGFWNRWTSNAPAFNPFGGGFNNYGASSSSSYSYGTPKTRLKWATETINNAADPAKNEEAAKLKNNSDQTDQKKKYQDYIDWYNEIPVDKEDSKAAPVSFEEFIAKDEDGLSEYDWWVKTRETKETKNPSAEVKAKTPEVKAKTPAAKASVKANAKPVVEEKVNDPSQDAAKINAANVKAATPETVTPTKPKVPEAKSYVDSDDSGLGVWDYIKMGVQVMNPSLFRFFEDGGFVDFDRPDLNKFVYGGDEYAYGGGVQRFAPGGQYDLNVKDPAGRNYQQYIDWYNEIPVDKGDSKAAPQTWAEWSAENKPATSTNTGTNTGTTNYNNEYFQNMFKNDPAFKQGFERFIQTQGYPTNSQLQQRQQQGNFQWTNKQGTPVVGFGPANQNFGSMLGRAFGFTKDFNYYTSPQGQITKEMISQMLQGKNPTGKVTQTQFKDRDKWWNPWDTKKVTEWTVDSATGQPTPASTTGTNNAPGYNPTAAGPGYSGYNADSDGNGIPDYLQVSNPQGKNTSTVGQGNNAGTSGTSDTDVSEEGTRFAPGMKIPRGSFLRTVRDGDYEGGIDRRGRLVERGERPVQPAPQPTAEQTNMMNQVSNFLSGRGVQPAASNQPIPTFNKNTTGNYADFNQSNMPDARIDGTAQPALAQPAPVSGIPYNTSGPMNVMDEEGMAYGGYVPGYMAYGGYMPDYGFGGYYPDGGSTVVGPNPDFAGVQQNNIAQDSDNNNIPDYLELGKDPAMGADANAAPTKYRLEEQTARTWDPKQTGRMMNFGLNTFSKLDRMGEFAKNREKENAEFMYAQDIDKQGRYRGLGDPNEGVWKDNIGFESGRTYASKYGGPKFATGGSQYAKGKVYSLTMDEINEIKRRGGSVKFIK